MPSWFFAATSGRVWIPWGMLTLGALQLVSGLALAVQMLLHIGRSSWLGFDSVALSVHSEYVARHTRVFGYL